MDIIDIVLSKKYTDESLKDITGTLAGKNCTIKSATKVDGVTTVVFAWTADDGTEKTTTIQVNDGVDGKDTSQEAVLFTEQKLDDTQRTQARENIGAADAARQNILMGSEIGNPIVVDDAFSAPLSGLTLHGKSTQMNTTGAQLLPFEVGKKGINFEVFEDGIALSGKKGTDIYAVGRPGYAFESAYDDFPLLAPGEYYIYSDGKYVELFVVTFVNGEYLILGSSRNGSAAKIKVIAGYKFRIFLRCKEDFDGKVKAIISKRYPTASNYEPYTGGKPSPSQEYPQEIESVGQDGEIEVKTLGANLFDASTALKTQIDAGLLHINDSGEVVLNGTFGTNNRNFYITLKPGVYCLTGGAIWHIIASKDSVFDRILTIDEETTYHCYISNGTYNEVVSNPMINAGSTALPYEPYKPAQTLIIPTPNGLSGIPVSSGGNYTDADGQQWVCDEVDFKKGVYVQRVATETPKAKWKNFEETADVPNRYRISGALVNRYRDGSTKCLISHGIYTNWGIAPGWALNSTTFYYHPKEDVTKEEAKEQILGFINSANPLTFLGQLETPIEKPLTTEQLATYKALRTYSPTTTVMNDADAWTQLDYQRDVNISIKKLEDAIASMTTT